MDFNQEMQISASGMYMDVEESRYLQLPLHQVLVPNPVPLSGQLQVLVSTEYMNRVL